MPMREMDRLCVDAAGLVNVASAKRLMLEKLRRVEREMAAYMDMWADAY